MKIKALCILVASFVGAAVHAQTSDFTYQGRLLDNGAPANGTYQLHVVVQDAATNQVGSAFAFPTVQVTNGLFTVRFDFGHQVFDGSVRFLQIGVRTNGSVAPYSILSPRQEITSAIYAMKSQSAVTSEFVTGNISDAQLSSNIPRLESGKLADTQLSTNIARLNALQTFTGSNTFRGGLNVADGTGPLGEGGTLHIGGYGASADAKLIKFGDGDFVTIGEKGADDLLQFTATTFAFMSGGDGFVGIGVTNPASKLQVAGTVTANSFVGNGSGLSGIPHLASNQTFTGAVSFSPASGAPFAVNNTAKVTNLNADQLDGLDSTSFWQRTGNSGTTAGTHFLGTTDNQALELKVNATRALRLEPNVNGAPNVVAGSPRNFVGGAAIGATIAGGGAVDYAGSSYTNSVLAPFGTVGGGAGNRIAPSAFSTIAGGQYNEIGTNSGYGTIVGGFDNEVASSSLFATIVAGTLNNIGTNSGYSFIGGGNDNNISSDSASSTIAGGEFNNIRSNSVSSTIGGGKHNGVYAINSTIAGGSYNVITNAIGSTVGGGSGNRIDNAFYATIAGGESNDVNPSSHGGTVGGGYDNIIAATSDFTTIAGGYRNDVGTNSTRSSIGGGTDNNISANSAYSTIAGGGINDIGRNAENSTIGGGFNNNIGSGSTSATISGGELNDLGTNCTYGVIAGGYDNNIGTNALAAVISGGWQNNIGTNSNGSTIAGGELNDILGYARECTIGGGYDNTIAENAMYSTISGGAMNDVGSNLMGATVGGGYNNNIGGEFATIPGGSANTANGYLSFAAGYRAKANHTGAYVWGDFNETDIASTNNNSMTVRASGGTRVYSTANATTGVFLAPGSGTWASMSDRNMKENFTEVDGKEILEKVAALPISTWNYKSQPETTRHIGPMAQDFSAAFNVGENNTSITSVDTGGVALAAIQGLNEVVKEKDAKIADLEKRLQELEQLVQTLARKR